MITLRDIIEVVSSVCKVSITQLKSKKRYRLFSEARGLYFLCAREYTDFGIIAIAKYINRHHATCVHFLKTTPELLKYDKKYRITYGDIQGKLNALKKLKDEDDANILKQIDVQIEELLFKKRSIISSKQEQDI